MGLIYSSADSSELMSALASNLSVARTITSELTAGCQQLIAAIDGHTLSGVAYNAGKGLFSELVIPTIHRMTAAIDHVQSDLTKYGAADAFISSEGYLNEDKLKLQIKIMKASQKSLHEAAKQVATIAYNTPIPGIHDLLKDTQRTFIQMADSLQQDIDKIQKKLQKLNDFAMQINGLFNNSLNEMELAMQGVMVLNETIVKTNGTYTLPKGTDKTWFTKKVKDAPKRLAQNNEKIELIQKMDTMEENSRKTLALANLGINPYTGEKISEKEANKFRYAAWAGTLTDVGNVVLGSYYGNKAASRLDGLDDAGNVKQKGFSKKASGFNYLDDQLGNMKNNVKVNKYESAESINNWWKNQGYDQPPYTSKTVVQDLDLLADTKFVRVYDGTNSKLHGGWLMEVEAIKGLTPAQIQDKFSLPHLPKYVGEVMVPKGSSLRMGEVNPLFEHKGGGVQFDLKGQYIGDFKELGTIKEWSGLK